MLFLLNQICGTNGRLPEKGSCFLWVGNDRMQTFACCCLRVMVALCSRHHKQLCHQLRRQRLSCRKSAQTKCRRRRRCLCLMMKMMMQTCLKLVHPTSRRQPSHPLMILQRFCRCFTAMFAQQNSRVACCEIGGPRFLGYEVLELHIITLLLWYNPVSDVTDSCFHWPTSSFHDFVFLCIMSLGKCVI